MFAAIIGTKYFLNYIAIDIIYFLYTWVNMNRKLESFRSVNKRADSVIHHKQRHCNAHFHH